MPAAKPLDTEKAYLLFHQDLAWKDAALALGVSPNRLRRLWIGRYGADAVRDRGAQHRKGATPEAMQEALAAFHSEEPSKKVAQRLGMSPNTLRDQWITTYGKSSLDERGTRLQAQGATLYGALSRGKAKKRSFVTALCVGCSQGVTLSKSQLSRLKDVICDTCKLVDKDTECPVCGLACKGAKGLATHFRHAGEDEAHRAYSVSAQERQWEGLVDGEDYVTCGVCGLRGKALTNHIKLHGLTAKEYEKAYPKFAIICKTSLSQKRINANQFSYDLTQDDLLKFVDSRGRVIAESAAKHFNCIEGTILRYCRMYGIPSRNNLAWQEAVLDQAKIYLKEEYEWEWSHPQAVNPETGRVFNYDGCFLQSKVVIEAHGDQHFSYSEKWHGSKATFLRMRERDTLKRRLVENLGYTLKVVRPSDPIYEPSFWSGLLTNDPFYWENKNPEERSALEDVVLGSLREEGFPLDLSKGAWLSKSESSRLKSLCVAIDSSYTIHPYSVRGTTACASFFPNRYDARMSSHLPSVREAWGDDDLLRKAIRLQLDSGHPTTPERVLKALIFFCRCPSVFRPAVAKYVYQTYCPQGGVVWDPCAGYGGRLMGAQAAGVARYIATDIEPLTVRGNRELAEALEYDGAEIHEARAEAFDPGPVDLVFTSPPYFNLETYGPSSEAAYSEYGDAEGWVDQFLVPVMTRAAGRLKPGGHLVLNLPLKPVKGLRLDLAALEVAQRLKLTPRVTVYLPIRSKNRSKREPLLVWER